jgi:hypothetical protein
MAAKLTPPRSSSKRRNEGSPEAQTPERHHVSKVVAVEADEYVSARIKSAFETRGLGQPPADVNHRTSQERKAKGASEVGGRGGYVGVTERDGVWSARVFTHGVTHKGKKTQVSIGLGSYDHAATAAAYVDAAFRHFHGVYAYQNFPDDLEADTERGNEPQSMAQRQQLLQRITRRSNALERQIKSDKAKIKKMEQEKEAEIESNRAIIKSKETQIKKLEQERKQEHSRSRQEAQKKKQTKVAAEKKGNSNVARIKMPPNTMIVVGARVAILAIAFGLQWGEQYAKEKGQQIGDCRLYGTVLKSAHTEFQRRWIVQLDNEPEPDNCFQDDLKVIVGSVGAGGR